MIQRPLRSRQPVPAEKVERLSISISAEDKAGLERIANEKRVSLAWVIRDAVTRYLATEEKSDRAPGKRG